MALSVKTIQQIKDSFESGLPVEDIAEQAGVTVADVRKMGRKMKWKKPSAAALKAVEGEDLAEASDILAAADEALQTNPGKRHSAMVFKRVHAALAGLKTLPPLKNWKDIELADKIARRAAGLDREGAGGGTVINLGIIASGYKPKLAPGKKVVDLDSLGE